LKEPAAKELFSGIFSRNAAAYKRRLDLVMARGEARGRAAVIDWVQPAAGKRILDLGCGPGTLSFPLAAAVRPDGSVVGIDLAAGMIAQATMAVTPDLPLRFELMDMEELRFPDTCFDAVVSGHSLQFCPDLSRALREARRVLAPGSRFAASVPVDPLRPSGPHAVLERATASDLPAMPRPRDQAGTRQTVSDPERFARAARDAGLGDVQVQLVEEMTSYPSAQHFVEMASSWWSMAVRLEQLTEAERTLVLHRARQAIESELGPGPYQIEGATSVLLAIT
jgi:ubiquinone/menaquinone biosynthesis C-methylase UbiE